MANFSLLAKIGLDSKGFQKGLNSAKAGVSKFGRSVVNASNKLAKMGLGAASAGFALLSKNAIALGSQLSDIAANTGFATKEFQVFRGALIDAGGTTTSMEKSIVTMQKAIVQGSEGLTTYARAFERLGLNIDDIREMKPEQQFMTIAKAISQAEDQQGALTAAIEIFGQRNAGRLIEVFKRLDRDGYGKMAKDIEKSYGIMTEATQRNLDRAADAIERFKNKATIRVGELIAGEADGAALKILGLAIAKAGSQIGVGLINGIVDSLTFARNAFGAFADFFYNQMATTAKLFGNTLKMEFLNAVNNMIVAINNNVPKVKLDLIDTRELAKKLERDLIQGSATFTDHLMGKMKGIEYLFGLDKFGGRQADQEPFDMVNRFGYDPAEFYDKEIEKLKTILDLSRKIDEKIDNSGSGGSDADDEKDPDGDDEKDPNEEKTDDKKKRITAAPGSDDLATIAGGGNVGKLKPELAQEDEDKDDAVEKDQLEKLEEIAENTADNKQAVEVPDVEAPDVEVETEAPEVTVEPPPPLTPAQQSLIDNNPFIPHGYVPEDPEASEAPEIEVPEIEDPKTSEIEDDTTNKQQEILDTGSLTGLSEVFAPIEENVSMLGNELKSLNNGDFAQTLKGIELDNQLAQKQLDTLIKIEANTEAESNTTFS